MPEISLNILDVAENSTRAGASLVQITVDVQPDLDRLTVIIADDGCGMTKEQVERVTDPFYTSRTTRKVGLGVPFFKLAAENTGGSFSIESEPGKGTTVTAVFTLNHIDRMPLGDMTATIQTLILSTFTAAVKKNFPWTPARCALSWEMFPLPRPKFPATSKTI